VNTLKVELGERSYPILIGHGLLAQSDIIGRHVAGRDVLVVSNTIVAPLYAASLGAALRGRRVVEVVLPDGESHKTLATVARILDVLVANRFARDCTVVALGGGVVGDMAGFAAACYQRGVAYVQVPTTLLAQVDSSVGGKTGVNHPGGKNLIGAFHQPVAVIADTHTLSSLPPRELRAGLAEVIKYGLICDAAFFGWLEAHLDELLAGDPAALAHVIRRSCEIKAAIVGRDEREHGDRALLNLGHTFGHAVESATHYTRWLHGEAVGAGLLMAASMSRECDLLDAQDVERLRRLLERTGLPTHIDSVEPAVALDHMRIDKKVKSGRMRLVLLRSIGDSFVTADYSETSLQRTLDKYFAARGSSQISHSAARP
jgi:3-dehydroquinate synthase